MRNCPGIFQTLRVTPFVCPSPVPREGALLSWGWQNLGWEMWNSFLSLLVPMAFSLPMKLNLSQSMDTLLFSPPTRVTGQVPGAELWARIKPNTLDLQQAPKPVRNRLEILTLCNCSAALLFRPGYRLANICKGGKKRGETYRVMIFFKSISHLF